MVIGAFDGWLGVVTFATALGCGVVAGVFFAFSTFVMPALARLPAAQAIAAMQSINVAAITPLFMLALFGTGAACTLLAIATLATPTPPGAGLDAGRADAAAQWTSFFRGWTAWNHVRTVSSLVAAALLTLAMRSR